MATLHVLNKAAAWTDCEPLLGPGDAVLLIEDGVYAARQPLSVDVPIRALDPDVQARGLSGQLAPNVELASFDDFVALVVSHDRVVTWSQ